MEAVFGSTPWANGIRSSAGSFPPVNVGSTAEEVDVYFFAPGVDPSSLDISIQNNVLLDYPPSSAARQPNLVASNPADIGKPRFLMMQTKVDFDQIWQCKEATR